MDEEKEKKPADKLEQEMYRMLQARVNDSVKLAFLTQEDRDLIDSMDLTALREFKRAGNGAVEVKFTDRMEIMDRLAEQSREDPAQKLLVQLSGESEE